MQILLLTHYFEPENGAPQRRWNALIREFTEAGHQVSVICPPPHYPSGRVPAEFRREMRPGTIAQSSSGAKVYRVGYLPHRGDIITRTIDHVFTSQRSYLRAMQLMLMRRERPDVIVATAPAVPTLIAAKLLAKRWGLPAVIEMRDAWPDLVTHTPGLQTGGGPIGWAKRRIHDYVTSLQRDSVQVVTTTQSFAEVLAERGVGGVEVIRNGTNVHHFEQVPPRVDDHDELRVLYMGNHGRSQGLDLVIRAVHALQARGVPIAARFVGAGHALAELHRLNEQLGGPVELLEQVAPSEVAGHYAWADSTIVSLRDWEPFAWTIPSKLYELLSSGRHITGILAGESADILREAQAGDVVTPGKLDELVALWCELAADRSRLDVGESGREWAREHISYPQLGGRYLELLTRIVTKHPRRGSMRVARAPRIRA